jgi:UDP-GlcNAc3NAcA epimerase
MLMAVVGNRPQFVKLAPIVAALKKTNGDLEILHSGQHHDKDMSDIFFQQLDLPKPRVQLSVTQRRHGSMTAELLEGIEATLIEKKPKGLLVFGDTNTTLAAVLAAVKLHIPIAHVEAGPRVNDLRSPEEVNRIVADHLSTFKFCPDAASVQSLAREGITSGVYLTGDTMLDAQIMFKDRAIERHQDFIAKLELDGEGPVTAFTIHRARNTDSDLSISRLLALLKALPGVIVFPVHPRTRAAIRRCGLWQELLDIKHVRVLEPLGFWAMIALLGRCDRVITDSGGVQKEAFYLGRQSLLVYDVCPWPDLEASGWVVPCGDLETSSTEVILARLSNLPTPTPLGPVFGDGNAGTKIVEHLTKAGWLV